MSAKAFRLSTGILAICAAAAMLWSILAGLPVWVPALVVIVTVIIKLFIRRKTVDTLTDERQTLLGNKASTITYRILTLGMAITGLVFIMLKNSMPDEYEVIGATLAFSACAMLIVYIASYCYLYVRSR
ncbi:MAG: DUF2178 domain-containing protein [Dehalococcoidales bacterium]|nr:DUF2178 domain-containing protein [Dehalococcoidales bacterium]